MQQINMFSELYEQFKFKKDTIRLFEAFAGVGSQAMALKKLSNEYNFSLETIGISEIDKYVIKSYEAIHGNVINYGDISKMAKLPDNIDIFTYSFPCQDISIAGKGKGLKKGSGTRSGLLWEIERLLNNSEKPQVLLMENVYSLVNTKYINDFQEWVLYLESLGYSTYWEVLNAKDYGIPQNRQRVFAISILGKYYYQFPKPFELKLRLKDLLEKRVDEKYYLSELRIQGMKNTNFNSYSYENKVLDKDGISSTILSRFEGAPQCIKENQPLCLNSKVDCKQSSFMPSIAIFEATKKGYKEAYEGDGVYINRPHQKRGVVQKDKIQTIKAHNDDIGVVVKAPNVINPLKDKSFYGWHFEQQVYDKEGITRAIKEPSLAIRKLIPKEVWRLMGFSDIDFNKAQAVNSNAQLYKQAGNSIVVDVLYYIFKELF